VARDRTRAKQRRERRGTTAGGRRAPAPGREGAGTVAPSQPAHADAPGALDHASGAGTVAPSQPTRADVPGALDHASADVDEFDAALVRGAEGVVATPQPATENGSLDEVQEEEPEELELEPAAGRAGGDGRGAAGGGDEGPREPGERGQPSGAPLREGNRAVAFLRASWAELQREQWPDRRQVTQGTAVVIGFVAIAGAYLGLADFVAKEIVEFVL
jgi:preprotein translocase subunit SecE